MKRGDSWHSSGESLCGHGCKHELYTNIFDPLKCSAGSTDGKIVFYTVHLCLKILILSIPVVKKGLRSHSQSRGSVKGQRWELYPLCLGFTAHNVPRERWTEIYTLLTNLKVEKSANIMRIGTNLAVWVGQNWSASCVGLTVAVWVGPTVGVAVHQFHPRWLRQVDYHKVRNQNIFSKGWLKPNWGICCRTSDVKDRLGVGQTWCELASTWPYELDKLCWLHVLALRWKV